MHEHLICSPVYKKSFSLNHVLLQQSADVETADRVRQMVFTDEVSNSGRK